MMDVACFLLPVAGIRTHIIPFVVKLTDEGQGETSLGKDEVDGNLESQEDVACRTVDSKRVQLV